jgi:hypothetical protein
MASFIQIVSNFLREFRTCIHAPRYLNQCVPGPATSLNSTLELPLFLCSYEVSTLNWWLRIHGAFARIDDAAA